MKLDMEQLEELYVEMIELEAMNYDAQLMIGCEHEDAGDRD